MRIFKKAGIIGLLSLGLLLFLLTESVDAAGAAPKVYLRFKVLSPKVPVYCKLSSLRRLTRPYRVNFIRPIPRSGAKYPKRWIKPEEYSKWIDITKLLEKSGRTDGFASSTVHLAFFSEKPITRIKVAVDISSSKNESGIARTVTEEVDGMNTIGILIPWDVAKMSKKIESITENVKKRHAEIKKIKKELNLDGEKTPKKIIMEVNCASWPAANIAKMERELLEDMGLNSILHLPGGYKRDKLHLNPKNGIVWGGCDNPTDFDASVEKLCLYNLPKKMTKNLYAVMMRDEPATSLNRGHVYKCADCAKAFREYLKKRKFKPSDFGKTKWDEISPTQRPDDNADLNTRKLHYLTVKFANHSATRVFAKMRELIHKRYKDNGKILCKTNYAGHPFLKKGIKQGAVDMFDLGENNAVDLLWTEDWLSTVGWFTVSNELSSYLGALFRAAAKYHDLPFGAYVTNGDGISTRQKTYSFLSQGAKFIHYYDYGPRYAKTDYGFWSDNSDRVKSVCELTREIAKVEDVLYLAKPRPAKTAILYSRSSDIWEKGNDPFILERRYIYLALVHDQVPVDFLTEEDVEKGYLDKYKALYVIGPNIAKTASAKIKQWVSDGGTLCVDAGSALRDEYNSPDKTLFPVMGITLCNTEIKKWRYNAGGRDGRIMKLPVAGKIKTLPQSVFRGVSMDASGCTQNTITAKGAKVAGSFGSGAPGIIMNKFGEGHCVLFNSLPGLAYIKGSNFTGKSFTTDYPAEIRGIITAPVKVAKIAKPVELSAPIIEAALLEGENGKIVILNNYAMKPVKKLKVVLRNVGKVKSLRSLEHGNLKFTEKNGVVEFSLPFAASDMITIK